jgi:RNA polymerase sigma-70 factor (ECF subfamily)
MGPAVKQSQQHSAWEKLDSEFLRYREAGDVEATNFVFGELSSVLSAYFRAKVRNDADAAELSQSTLLKIHMHRMAFREDLSLRTWVFTIAARTLTDHWRSLGRRSSRIDSEVNVDDMGAFSNGTSQVDDRLQCEKLLAHLSPADRNILRAYVVEDLAIKDIADAQGVSEGSMKVKLHRLYKNLRHIGESPLVLLLFFGLSLLGLKPNSTPERISEQKCGAEEGL